MRSRCTRDRQCFVQGNRTARDPIGDRLALDQLEHERVGLAAVFESVNRRDVRMIERGEELRFPFETSQAIGVEREIGWEHLESDISISFRSRARYTFAHAAGTQRAGDLVGPMRVPGVSAISSSARVASVLLSSSALLRSLSEHRYYADHRL